MEENIQNSVKKGTTTVGIVCKDGIVLAADKRASAGYLVANRKMQKIHNVTDNMAVTMAGLVSDAQLIVKLIRAELRLKRIRSNEDPSVKEAGNLLASILYQNIRKMSMVPGIVSFLLGGKDRDGFKLYELGVDGSISYIDDYVSTGSGSVVAYGVLETLYNGNLTVKEGIQLAKKAINAAIKRDMPTGDGIDIFVINEKGAHRVETQLIEKEIL